MVVGAGVDNTYPSDMPIMASPSCSAKRSRSEHSVVHSGALYLLPTIFSGTVSQLSMHLSNEGCEVRTEALT